MMMFHKVEIVTAMEDYRLLVVFKDGTEKLYDVKPLFERFPVFNELRTTPGLFEQVRVDAGGYGICWNDKIDLACNELWHGGSIMIISVNIDLRQPMPQELYEEIERAKKMPIIIDEECPEITPEKVRAGLYKRVR